MKTKLTLLLATIFYLANTCIAQTTISDARSQGEGAIVTIQGVVTCDDQFNGSLRYLQDATGGLAIFSDDVAFATLGNELKVKGTLTQYNELLELVDVSSVELINESATVPEPILITSLSEGFIEANEGKLIKFENVSFSDNGSFDTSSANYMISDGDTQKAVRVWSATDIVGTPIPSDPITLIGILGQYQETYQLQPRSLSDIVFAAGKPVISSALMQSNISKNSFDVCFTTQNAGTTLVSFKGDDGSTGDASSSEMVTDHCVTLENLNPAVIYEVTAVSASAEGETSGSSNYYMVTESESSGAIEVHFNNPVDTTVATTQNANYSNNGFGKIIIDLINKAQTTLDLAVYNLDDKNGIISAINEAHERGVTIRMVIDSGVEAFRASSIKIGDNLKISPASQGAEDGIMHNKFIVVDANSADANAAYVLSGSTNWTDGQLNKDPNNIIIVQDQSLAKVFTKEFEEMFLDDLFGSEKTANTPSQLRIGGKDVSVHFSPSDDVENIIKQTIATTDFNLYIALLSFTRFGISYDIEDLINERKINAYGIVNDTTGSGGFAYSILNDAAPEEAVLINQQGNIFHHKYLIVDPNHTDSDPAVLTGSHNWSTSAQTRNDENIIIVHDANIANQYYQEFVARLLENSGMITGVADFNSISSDITLFPNPAAAATQFKFELMQAKNYELNIIDFSGRTVETLSGKAVSGANQIDINTNNFENGLYLIELNLNGQLDVLMPLMVAK